MAQRRAKVGTLEGLACSGPHQTLDQPASLGHCLEIVPIRFPGDLLNLLLQPLRFFWKSFYGEQERKSAGVLDSERGKEDIYYSFSSWQGTALGKE